MTCRRVRLTHCGPTKDIVCLLRLAIAAWREPVAARVEGAGSGSRSLPASLICPEEFLFKN